MKMSPTSILLQKAYQTYLKLWYAQTPDPDIVLWRTYFNPETERPRQILHGSAATVMLEGSQYCGISGVSAGPAYDCNHNNWILSKTQIFDARENLPGSSLPLPMRWFLESTNTPPLNISIPGGLSLTNYNNIFFHPTAGIIYNIAGQYGSISPATSSVQTLTTSGKLSSLVNSNALIAHYEEVPTTDIYRNVVSMTLNLTPTHGTIVSFWFYYNTTDGDFGSIITSQGTLSLELQSNILKIKSGPTILFELSAHRETWMYYTLYNYPGGMGVLENGIPSLKKAHISTGKFQKITFDSNDVHVSNVKCWFSNSINSASSVASITKIMESNITRLITLSPSSSSAVSCCKSAHVPPPDLWVFTPGTVWLDITSVLSNNKNSHNWWDMVWEQVWNADSGPASIWIKMKALPATGTYSLYVREKNGPGEYLTKDATDCRRFATIYWMVGGW